MSGRSGNRLDYRTAQLFRQNLLVNFCLFLINDIALIQCDNYWNPKFQKLCGKKRLLLRFVASTILMITSGFSFLTYPLVMLSSDVKGDIE